MEASSKGLSVLIQSLVSLPPFLTDFLKHHKGINSVLLC